MPNWTGKIIGKVIVGEMIARGGMAEVYMGQHTALGRAVAVKIMREQVDGDPDSQTRFEREARVVAGLRHPNIIQMYDYELVEGRPCIIMEYAPGASLGNYLKALHKRGERLGPDVILKIFSALASAIDYSHAHNIIHRDIKPANVLLRSASGEIDPDKPLPADVEPILTDFGLVRLLDSTFHTSTGTVSGTPAYMSPEQSRGDAVDKRTDIYSLGIMLYEMLAGNVPFDADSSFGVLMRHINDMPPPIPTISSDMQMVVDRALAKDPESRYQSAKELVDEYTAVFNGQTVSMNTITILKEAQKAAEQKNQPKSRINWRMIEAICVALIAVIGVIYGLQYFRGATTAADAASLGSVNFADVNSRMDAVEIVFTGMPKLEQGSHYEVWFISANGQETLNAGAPELDENGNGVLDFTDSNGANLLGLYDHVEVTLEPDDDAQPDVSSGEVVASSVFPPLALLHVRHVLSGFGGAPDGTALIEGVWVSANNINTTAIEIQEALESSNEELLRLKTEELINQIVGTNNEELYRDWNENGVIDDPGDGYGLLVGSGPQYSGVGYINQAASHARFAAESADATANIITESQNVRVSLNNIIAWTDTLLAKALDLKEMEFGPDMETVVHDMVELSNKIVNGSDVNADGQIEPIEGEGGARTALQRAYLMSQMPLLPGPRRTPLPANSE